MRLPDIISKKIEVDQQLDGFVKFALSNATNHINANRMEFFPEYTDHSVDHLEDVLATCIDFATPESIEILDAIDAGILSIAVALHDLGMHLTKDGFESLIEQGNMWRPISGFNDHPWNELWLEFLSEARRYDDTKLRLLFGDNYQPIIDFPEKGEPWNEFDYLLVGEFLRRHHPRLAHEIAVYGMPAKSGDSIKICQNDSEEQKFLCDIAGLVARSHGMKLRPCIEYLDNRYDNRINPRGIHALFLMVLLRIADYFQIQSSRAPKMRTKTISFRSPISTREWSVHQCIKDISNNADPESFDLIAEPNNVDTYLRVKYWLSDLQHELDVSWAVLGEVYGLLSHNQLDRLGLRIRRIRSNPTASL